MICGVDRSSNRTLIEKKFESVRLCGVDRYSNRTLIEKKFESVRLCGVDRYSNRTHSKDISSNPVTVNMSAPYSTLDDEGKRLRRVQIIDLLTVSLPLLPTLPEYDFLEDRKSEEWTDHPIASFRRKII